MTCGPHKAPLYHDEPHVRDRERMRRRREAMTDDQRRAEWRRHKQAARQRMRERGEMVR